MTSSAAPRPSVAGSLGFLVMNLAVGIAGFVGLVVLTAVGLGTAVIWVGVPVLVLAVLCSRGGARLERARIYAMLDADIPAPYPRLPEEKRFRARFKDVNTYRDALYFLLMLPVGIFEFVVVVVLWSVGLGLLALPVYYRWLPGGVYRGFDWGHPQFVVASAVDALPFALVGVVLVAVAVLVTRGLGAAHVRFARALLGPARDES
ncbi:sensor domain-containing protein [Actinokineospora bangkokensis]|uniref:Two-component system sensor kinase n=1 Tax=Actinokineospora bangkokensis TaxID=1193682 RepID=A0A1Q9LDX6_9PSEU|nr:sensor domain-containing protein [Actinokineospora bangkokensis]OLR90247.1 two-component system sensor kinase [Actinokineospora bangkokensis]